MTDHISASSPTPAPMFDLAEWERRREQEEALVAQALPANKQALFDALAGAGITSVLLHFDGYGDSGQVEDIDVSSAGDAVELPTDEIALFLTPWGASENERVVMPLPEALERLVYDLLSQSHCGWENNDGAYGDFIFTVADRSITLDYNERFTATELYSHSW
ncbi:MULTISPECIES: DUF6878 family protein [Sphingomonadales]|uniref:DUF6878 family protein n=1 Tax=Sphingomonadales TaxID=204457 RepID=UPI00086A0ED3|nr:DUF6878 family protein [Novosphingobium sp. SCN 63-17]ODU76579.1 MAG: hypothetical protein ABT10_26270 [Novosphingobium sp. SCN 63-17]